MKLQTVVAGGSARVGVLGGIGPEATGEFYGKLIKRLQERGLIRENSDFPQIVINSIPAPELINESITDAELGPYMEGLKELDNFGVDFIVMVCNTIHLFHKRLQNTIRTPILDLREEVRKTLHKGGVKTALVIGTLGTIRMGLYRFPGIKTIEPDGSDIQRLSQAIFNFNRGVEREKQIQCTNETCRKYLGCGSGKVILGCTEFAVMLGASGLPTLNTIDVLVEAAIDRLPKL